MFLDQGTLAFFLNGAYTHRESVRIGKNAMPSVAWRAFRENAHDIERLMEIHGIMGGTSKGRRFNLEVLNKSAIVLITAIWEAYYEDIASEALQHIVEKVPNAEALPDELKKRIAKELKGETGSEQRSVLPPYEFSMREPRLRWIWTEQKTSSVKQKQFTF